MLTGQLRNDIDRIWDDFWSGGISNPLSVIEQMTYLLFIKRLDEIHTRKERQAALTGEPIEDPVFQKDQQDMRWSRFKNLEPGKMFDIISQEVFPFIKTLQGGEGGAFARFMKDAVFMIPTPQLLSKVVSKVSDLPMESRDLKGDVYEYLLSKLSSAGRNGQFRTPRHIIRMMVELTAPTVTDTICDPASGTCGFLVGANEYLRERYGDLLMDRTHNHHFHNDMFYGNDFDATMLRIGAMNLILHGITGPNLSDKDALSQANEADRSRYSLILANPPFKGSLDDATVAKDLHGDVKTKKTELLFLALFNRMLRLGGRCACIVPDGVLFGSSAAHKDLRKMLMDDQRLMAVISMPSGVFKPYAGVSTAVLYFHKTDSGGTDNVWFYDMRADGFSLDDKRTPLAEGVHENNNIPDILKRAADREGERARKRTDQSFMVPVQEIRDNGYDLSINRYKEIQHEETEYQSPKRIISQLKAMERDIMTGLDELEGMLG